MTNDFQSNAGARLPLDDRMPDDRDAESATMLRSEERLDVRVEAVPVERVRLEKYIVTEERTITVMVSREEVRLVREPINGGESSALTGSASTGPVSDPVDLEMVLGAEEIVVTKKVVPVERVRLIRDRVTEVREVTDTVRKERVDLERIDSAVR